MPGVVTISGMAVSSTVRAPAALVSFRLRVPFWRLSAAALSWRENKLLGAFSLFHNKLGRDAVGTASGNRHLDYGYCNCPYEMDNRRHILEPAAPLISCRRL